MTRRNAPCGRRQCAICTIDIDGAKLDDLELAYGRYHSPDPDGSLPARGDYLRYAAILLLEKVGKRLTVAEIAAQLKCTEADRVKRLTRYLNQLVDAGFLQVNGDKYSVNSRYANSWNRIRQLVELFGLRFFTSSTGNALQITDGDQTRWMTTLDLAFLSLFTLNLLIEESTRNNILLVGITKDTAARDLVTHLIPVCRGQGIWSEKVEHVATTDQNVAASS